MSAEKLDFSANDWSRARKNHFGIHQAGPVTISEAQLRELHTTGVQVLAGEASAHRVPVAARFGLAVGGAYTLGDATGLMIKATSIAGKPVFARPLRATYFGGSPHSTRRVAMSMWLPFPLVDDNDWSAMEQPGTAGWRGLAMATNGTWNGLNEGFVAHMLGGNLSGGSGELTVTTFYMRFAA